MSTAKERQAKRRAKIKADPELYEAQLLKDREQQKHQHEALGEMLEQQLEEHKLKEWLRIKNYQEFIIYSRERVSNSLYMHQTHCVNYRINTFSVNKVSASICYSASIFNSSKTCLTLNSISRY